MKIAPIILTSLFTIAACAFASDENIRNSLLGVWRDVQSPPQQDGSVVNLVTFAPNASFTNRIILPGAAREIDFYGTFQVQDGYLIMTTTKSSHSMLKGLPLHPVNQLPLVSRLKIMQADDSQMVVIDGGTTYKQTFKRETK